MFYCHFYKSRVNENVSSIEIFSIYEVLIIFTAVEREIYLYISLSAGRGKVQVNFSHFQRTTEKL